jgi:FkbM family methyltransferase
LTYFFYQRGWRGVNLEPVPWRQRELKTARPGDLNLALAAWDSNGEIPYFEGALAGDDVVCTFSPRRAADYLAQGLALCERKAPVRTIGSLAEELEIEPPDFLVIDAQGAEEPVIRGIALDRWRPRVFVITASALEAVEASRRPWDLLLQARGYLPAAFNGVSRFYVRDDLGHLRARLEVPVSVLDRFERAEVVALREQVQALETESARWRADSTHWRERSAHLTQAERSAVRQQHWAEAERDAWRQAWTALHQELSSTQRALRPYRMIDQLGVVQIGYRWARRLKSRRASAS